jgi:pimeloyl-ACP methyl ester carboxylesterase
MKPEIVIKEHAGEIFIREFAPKAGKAKGTALLVHGFAGPEDLAPYGNLLAKNGFRALQVHLPGHGKSELGAKDLEMEGACNKIQEAIRRVLGESGKISLSIGHSIGCAILQELKNRGLGVGNAVLFSPVDPGVLWGESEKKVSAVFQAIRMAADQRSALMNSDMESNILNGRPDAHILLFSMAADITDLPVNLVAISSNDPFFGLHSTAKEMAERLRANGATVYLLEGDGHYLFADRAMMAKVLLIARKIVNPAATRKPVTAGKATT